MAGTTNRLQSLIPTSLKFDREGQFFEEKYFLLYLAASFTGTYLFTKTNQHMELSRADMFILANARYFERHHLLRIREILQDIDDEQWASVQTLPYKDPNISFTASLLVGTLGIDRFLIGDTGPGIAKLVTCGGFGVWTFVDMFLIIGLTREKNWELFQRYC